MIVKYFIGSKEKQKSKFSGCNVDLRTLLSSNLVVERFISAAQHLFVAQYTTTTTFFFFVLFFLFLGKFIYAQY